MSPHSIIRTLAATALIALPSIAMAAPDQNTNNNGCPNGQWRNNNGQCVGNGQWNNNGNGNGNGQWNNGRHRDRDDRGDRDDRNRRDNDDRNNNNNNGRWNNGSFNNGYNQGYNNGSYNNGRNGNRGGQLSGQVSSFSPYNLYLSNGTHVVLHNGTVINPTGANLGSGQRVRVIGNWNQDGTFNANEIDVVGNGYGNGNYRYQR